MTVTAGSVVLLPSGRDWLKCSFVAFSTDVLHGVDRALETLSCGSHLQRESVLIPPLA